MSSKNHNPNTAVVVVAAGRSARLGGSVPKQFLMLAGRPLFSYSLGVFDALAFVSEIVLVLPGGKVPEAYAGELEGRRLPIRCVAGGARRQDSAAEGLAALCGAYDVALVHDAARPFPEPKAIERLVAAAMESGGGLLAMHCADTVKRANAQRQVAETLDRESIWLAQTPQAIRADLVARAVEAFRRTDVEVTDEAALLEMWGVPVALVESTANNFKITTPEDLARASAILATRRS